jgi:hypothetical protein
MQFFCGIKINTAKINKSHNKSFQLAIVLFLDQKFKIYMGGGDFLKGGDISRIFTPRGAIFLGYSPLPLF